MTITKKDFIKQLMDEHNHTKRSATMLVEDFLSMIQSNFERGNSVFFYGFGCFDLVKRAEKRCYNPTTREAHTSPEHYSPRFYPGNTLKRAVKKYEDDVKRGLK